MKAIIWTIVLLVFIGWFVIQLGRRYSLLSGLRKDDGRDYSPGTWGTRLKNTLIYAFGQKKFFAGEQPAGWMHIIIFLGFMVLLIQVVTMFGRGWFESFHFPGFSASLLGPPYSLVKEILEVIVAVAVCFALVRWLVLHPSRLMGFLPAEKQIRESSHWEASLILCFIFLIMLSGLFYDAGRLVYLAGTPAIEAERAWQPISAALSKLFSNNPQLAETVSQISWWIHNVIILIFINLLPRSKHFHIITAIPNVFFGRIDSKGKLPKKDYEAEDALFGRSQIDHFTQKQALDMFSCTECGRCASVCPATSSGKPLAPRQFLVNLRNTLYGEQSKLIASKGKEPPTLEAIIGEDKAILDEVIWSCNACRACEEVCPVNIEYVDKIIDIRQHLVQEVSRFPAELNRAFKGMETQSNPWGISSEERTSWAEGLNAPILSEKPDAEYLYYVGCGNSFDACNKSNAQAFVKILNKAGVSFAILGNKELCNCETSRRLGNEYLYQTMAQALVDSINESGVKKILVNCPHCYNTFKNEYPDFGGNWEVVPAASFVKELVTSGKITLDGNFDKKVVYHDSCYYGRFNDLFDEPRDLIKAVPGAKLEEMDQCGKNAMCCGAGGGRMWMEEEKDQRVNMRRVDQALEKKPDVIATSCPFCKIMVGSAVNEMGKEAQTKPMDVMEIVAAHLAD